MTCHEVFFRLGVTMKMWDIFCCETAEEARDAGRVCLMHKIQAARAAYLDYDDAEYDRVIGKMKALRPDWFVVLEGEFWGM